MSTRTDELVHELQHLLGASATPPLEPSERDALEARLRQGWHDPAPWVGVRLVQRYGPPLVVAASVAAVGALAVTLATRDAAPVVVTATPVAVDRGTEQALVLLAARTRQRPVPEVRDDQFVYVRSTVISNDGELGGPVALGAPHEREIWLSQASRPVSRSGLIRELGQDWPLDSGGYRVPAGPIRPTYAWTTTLPTDPDDLIAELASDQQPDSEQTREQFVFDRMGDLLGEGLLPPEVAEALFRAVTTISGVATVAGATDALGRTGVGIQRSDERFHTTTQWVFRPGSAELLGVRWYVDTPRGRVLFGATAVLERGVVDAIGERPTTSLTG